MNLGQTVTTRLRESSVQTARDTREVRNLVSDIKARWRESGKPDARAVLSQYPWMRSQKSLVLELAYEEYCLRLESNQPVEAESFCSQYSSVSRSLFRQIEVDEYLRRHAGLLAHHDLLRWPGPGDTLFEFTVLEELGRGALARVYLCSQAAVGDRQVVIKVAHEGAYEAETLGRLNHPCITPVYSVIQDHKSGVSGICMPFRGRSTLCDVLDLAFENECRPLRAQLILRAAEQQRVPTDQYDTVGVSNRLPLSGTYVDGIVHLGIQLADALQHAHDKGILHGDLKPSNVLLTPDGMPLLLDFNLSLGPRSRSIVAGGTLPYMSPEQIQWMLATPNQKRALPDAQSDVFSLGVILYELLSGCLPFGPGSPGPDSPGSSERDRAESILREQRSGAVSLRQLNPDVDARVADCIKSCLSWEQAERPASMQELADTLREHFVLQRRARRWIAAHRWMVLTVSTLFLFLIVTSAVFFAERDPYAVRQFNQGTRYYQTGEYAEAIDSFSRALKENPAHAEALYRRARAHLKRGEIALAKADLETAITLRESGKDFACLGYCHSLTKDFVRARGLYARALDLGYGSAGVYNNLGYAFLDSNNLIRARELLDRAIELNNQSHVPYFNRALVDLRQAQVDSAYIPRAGLADMKRAISIAPPSGELYYLAACICGLVAREDAASVEQGLEFLKLACDNGVDLEKSGVKIDSAFEPFRSHPEFAEILKRSPSTTLSPRLRSLLDPIREEPLLRHP